MPVVSLPVSVLCLGSQALAMYSIYNFAVPPEKFMPEQTKYLGRFMFLTFQSNLFLTGYYSLSLASNLLSPSSGSIDMLDRILVALHPMAFGLGTFLTSAYYLLDHFNPEQVVRRKQNEKNYPYIQYDAHLEHGLAAPFVIFFTSRIMQTPFRATSGDVNAFVGGYIIYFLFQTHLNKWATGFWPYPIIDDMEKMGGHLARNAFFAGLTGIFVGLGYCGKAYFEHCQQ
mmetsp:Transcript_38396/g.61634  ORF Transcript_38396/g.61634 Transcript_38396/m.61634 type:complete len:228 (-) Transcript_38396:194-877(-)